MRMIYESVQSLSFFFLSYKHLGVLKCYISMLAGGWTQAVWTQKEQARVRTCSQIDKIPLFQRRIKKVKTFPRVSERHQEVSYTG